MKASLIEKRTITALTCFLMLALSGPVCQGSSTTPLPPSPAAKDEALRIAADLRSGIEKRARADAWAVLERSMGAIRSVRTLNNYGMTLLLAGSPANALVVLTEAARRAPDAYLAFNNLGALLNNLGRCELALPLLRYADSLSPENAMVLSNLGVAELGCGDAVRAEKLFLRAVSRWPKHPEANYALGLRSVRNGAVQTARIYFERSLEGAFTDKAARALRDIEREERRAARRSGRQDSGQQAVTPPPAPARAAEAGKDLRMALPEIEKESLAAFVGSEKTYEAIVDALQSQLQPAVLELRDLAFPFPAAVPSAQPPAVRSDEAGRKVLRLGDGMVERGLDQAMRWQGLMTDRYQDFVRRFTDLVKRVSTISAEQYKIFQAELAKCWQIHDRRAREACEKEACKRACGRYYPEMEPLYREFVEIYEQSASGWERAAIEYVRSANYWAGFLTDPKRAKTYRVEARAQVTGSYHRVVSLLPGACNVFTPPCSCFEMPPPPPPSGELRIEDFVVPCGFPGISLDLQVASLSIDCTTVRIGGEIGYAVAELEWNFVDKTGTLFLGMEGEIEGGKLVPITAGARLGLGISFNGEEITGIGLSGEAEISGQLDLGLKSIDLGALGVSGEIGLNSGATFGWKED